jgi:hypothetical protein
VGKADECGRIDADANPFDKHVGAYHGAASSTVLPQSWKAAENVGTDFAQRHATVRNACAKEGRCDVNATLTCENVSSPAPLAGG